MKYEFFKDNQPIDGADRCLSNNSTVVMYQVENSNIWTIEVFPENQSQESFEKSEFFGTINMITKDWSCPVPNEWKQAEEDELKDVVNNFIKSLKYEVIQ